MIGQTAEIAPADKKLYALRDVTATVESPYLICASIMSKKLAEGLDALVLDVKTGSGAFMKREEDAAFLAELMVETGRRMGKRVVALLTDMDQPLGRNVGNALEVAECIEVLRGAGPDDLRELCLELAAWMMLLGGRGASLAACRSEAEQIISSGRALATFREMVRLQGGDERVVEEPRRLPQAAHGVDVVSAASGRIAEMACEQIGVASCLLGGGREKKEDTIDPAVGLVLHKKVGDSVAAGEPLFTVHYNSESKLAAARALLEQSYRIERLAEGAPPERKLVLRVIEKEKQKI
jgi:pyrimidine-nucleoside phosphorylase